MPSMSISDTGLALVAATIGGEIVAIPFAVSQMGLVISLLTIILIAAFSHISNLMYLATKDLVPGRFESVYEIGYVLTGRKGIYLICAVQYLLNFISMVL